MGNGMTHGTGNPSLTSWVIYVVVIWIVKRTAEEGHWIMTTCAPARSLNRSVATAYCLTSIANSVQVSGLLNELKCGHYGTSHCKCLDDTSYNNRRFAILRLE